MSQKRQWDLMHQGIFESDTDLAVADVISNDAGIELWFYEINTKEAEHGGKGLEATREHLNNGILARLFEEYATFREIKVSSTLPKELAIIFLSALAMRFGATISTTDMERLRVSIQAMRVLVHSPDFHFTSTAKAQMEIALMAYYRSNGTPFNVHAPRCAVKCCSKAQEDLAEGQKILKCGTCKNVYYCSTDCQRFAWPLHRRWCTTTGLPSRISEWIPAGPEYGPEFLTRDPVLERHESMNAFRRMCDEMGLDRFQQYKPSNPE